MSTLTDYTEELPALLQAEKSIVEDAKQLKQAVKRALQDYSKRKPREAVIDLASDGSGDFNTAGLTAFEDGFSAILKVEYPISENGNTASYLEPSDYSLYRKPSGLFVRIPRKPGNGESVRFTFSARHTITATASTVPDIDFWMMLKLIAAELYMDLARHYTHMSENNYLSADMAAYRLKSDQCKARAKELREEAYWVPFSIQIA